MQSKFRNQMANKLSNIDDHVYKSNASENHFLLDKNYNNQCPPRGKVKIENLDREKNLHGLFWIRPNQTKIKIKSPL